MNAYYSMRGTFKILITCLAMMTSCTVVSLAAEASMHTSMSTKSFFVGEEFLFEIFVSSATKVKVEEVKGDDDLAIRFFKQELVKQGDLSTVVVRYRMMPLSAGTVMIPPISVEVGDQVLTTDEEMFIDVEQAENYPGMELIREIPERDLYLGEPFIVNYKWKSPLQLNGFRAVKLNLPMFYDDSFKIRNPYKWIAGDDKAAIGFPVANTRVIGRYAYEPENGVPFQTVSFAKIAIPVRTGEHTIMSGTLLTSYVAPPPNRNKRQQAQAWKTNYPSYFNNNFFTDTEGAEYKKYYVASKAAKINVLPLPDAGKPHDFADLVGACRIKVTATPTVLKAGDPITLTVEVDDYRFPEILELPDLGKQAAFTRQFAIPPRQSTGRIQGNRKTYIRTLRPLGQDTTVIPSVRIPYFDPKTKSYGVAESKPIPITVQPAELVTAFDATMSGSGPLKNHVQRNLEGIRANFVSMKALHGNWISGPTWLLILLLLPPLGFLVFLMTTAKQRLARRDPVRARSLGASKRFRESMNQFAKSGQEIGELDNIVRSYFADKLNLVRHAHTFEELEQAIGGRADIEPIRAIYHACAYETYREQEIKADVDALAKQAEQCVKSINPFLS